MVTYELTETTQTHYYYAYFVEGDKTDVGVVSLSLQTREANVEKFAKSDNRKKYGFHLVTALEDMATRECLKDSGTIMWY